MLIKLTHRASVIFLLSVLILSSLTSFAQNRSTPGDKQNRAANESCDGALDIVPSKPMTFARKRRPSGKESKQQPAPDAKSEKRKPGDGR
jgi:hypothetical protein